MMQSKLKYKDIDFLTAYSKKSEPSKYAPILKYAVFPLIATIVIGGVFAFQTLRTRGLKSDTKKLNQEIADIKKTEAENPNIKKAADYVLKAGSVLSLNNLYNNIQSYPALSQNTFDQILLAADLTVDITSFSYLRESQVISLQIETKNVNDPEYFVRRLKVSGIFGDVSYSGYSLIVKNNESDTGSDDSTGVNKQPTTDSSSDNAAMDALLEALLKKSVGTTTKTPETTKVYTATILCRLK